MAPLPRAPGSAIRDLVDYLRAERDGAKRALVVERLRGMVEWADVPARDEARSHIRVRLDGDDTICDVDGVVVDLDRRTIARAMLHALAIGRLHTPDLPLAWTRLASLTWPGERILRAAAKNRVKVAIACLRKLGLRHVVASDQRGYWLTGGCEVVAPLSSGGLRGPAGRF